MVVFSKGWLYPGLARPLRISYKFLLSVALGSLPLERKKERNKQRTQETKSGKKPERMKEEKKGTKKKRNKANLA